MRNGVLVMLARLRDRIINDNDIAAQQNAYQAMKVYAERHRRKGHTVWLHGRNNDLMVQCFTCLGDTQ